MVRGEAVNPSFLQTYPSQAPPLRQWSIMAFLLMGRDAPQGRLVLDHHHRLPVQLEQPGQPQALPCRRPGGPRSRSMLGGVIEAPPGVRRVGWSRCTACGVRMGHRP